MAASLIGGVCMRSPCYSFGFSNLFHTTSKALAARKGTREKARKKKVKVEVKKIGFIPHNLRNLEKLKAEKKSSRSLDMRTEEPVDIVFATKYYKTLSYPISEAIQFHREANHPSIRNKPNAPVQVTLELNMVAEKKTRFIDKFSRIVTLPNPFGSFDDRTVLAFCKTPEQIDEAVAAGADLAGGPELIPRIQSGELSLVEFRFVVCHPAMLPELVPVRGLLKRKFPSAKTGTLSPDLAAMLEKFKKGLQYSCQKDPDEHDLGLITVQIGSLEMETQKLEDNFAALVKDVESARPKRAGDFVTWVWCDSPPNTERFKVSFRDYLEAAE